MDEDEAGGMSWKGGFAAGEMSLETHVSLDTLIGEVRGYLGDDFKSVDIRC